MSCSLGTLGIEPSPSVALPLLVCEFRKLVLHRSRAAPHTEKLPSKGAVGGEVQLVHAALSNRMSESD